VRKKNMQHGDLEVMTVQQVLEQLHVNKPGLAIVALTPEGTVCLWNRVCKRLFGYTQVEALGRSVTELIVPPAQRDEDLRLRRQALQDDQHVSTTVRRHKAGGLVHVDMTVHAVRHDDGRLRCHVLIMRDVTDRKCERDARWIGQHGSVLLESLPDALLGVNDAGRIVLINARAERLLQYPRDGLVGAALDAVLPDCGLEGCLGQLRLAGGKPLRVQALRGNGDVLAVDMVPSLLDTAHGRFVLCSLREAASHGLASRFNGSMRSALSSMNRQLRTPLMGVIGFAQLMLSGQDGELTAEQERQLGIIMGCGEELQAILDTVLSQLC
jgi:PAS domain S-box-containing protein